MKKLRVLVQVKNMNVLLSIAFSIFLLGGGMFWTKTYMYIMSGIKTKFDSFVRRCLRGQQLMTIQYRTIQGNTTQ